MIGNHAVPVVVDAILKGLPGIDVDKAYEAVKMSLTTPHLNSPFEGLGPIRLHAGGLADTIGVYHVGTELRRLVCGAVGQAFE